MGAEVCSEIPSLVVSPRISFSHDLKESDTIPVESHHRRSDEFLLESIDFNFNFCSSSSSITSCNQRLLPLPMSSADELFANGKILPVDELIRKKPSRELLESKPISPSLRRNFNPPLSISRSRTDLYQNHPSIEEEEEESRKKSLKELLSINSDDADEDEDQEVKNPPPPPPRSPPPPPSQPNKPFWQQFRRSSSLNFDTRRANNLIRSLHFLSRSNSTGSAPNSKPTTTTTKIKQNQQKEPSSSIKRTNSSSSSSCTQYNNYNSFKTPSLRKNHSNGGGGGHGIRISPVLHIPHACISRNSVFLGFSSLFCNGKSKKKKKSL